MTERIGKGLQNPVREFESARGINKIIITPKSQLEMKKIIIAALTFIIYANAYSQVLAPVKWSYGAKKVDNATAIIFIKATIDNGWHIYSQTVKDGGPIKTTLTFTPADGYSLLGITAEPKPITHYEKAFSMDVQYFEKTVVFQQKVKLTSNQQTVKGSIQFMACNSKQCLPPDDVDFTIPIQ